MPRHRDANPHGFVSHVACGGAHTLWIASTTEHPTPKTPNVTRLFGCGLNTSGQLGFTRTQAGATSPLARSPKASKSPQQQRMQQQRSKQAAAAAVSLFSGGKAKKGGLAGLASAFAAAPKSAPAAAASPFAFGKGKGKGKGKAGGKGAGGKGGAGSPKTKAAATLAIALPPEAVLPSNASGGVFAPVACPFLDARSEDLEVVQVACGLNHSVLLVHNRALVPRRNQVYTFGEGDGGRLGHGDEDSRAAPTLVASFEDETPDPNPINLARRNAQLRRMMDKRRREAAARARDRALRAHNRPLQTVEELQKEQQGAKGAAAGGGGGSASTAATGTATLTTTPKEAGAGEERRVVRSARPLVG